LVIFSESIMRTWGILILLAAIGCQGKPEPAKTNGSETPEAAGGNPEVPEAMEPAVELLPPLSEQEIQAGWIRLFDGESLFGWEADDAGETDAVNWRVEEGIITADADGPGLLMTWVPFADYEFRCEYRLAEGGNSGVFLRTVPNPANPAVDCYELNFCEDHKTFPTGSLVGRMKVSRPLLQENEWTVVEVAVKGPRIQARFNGEEVLDFTDQSENQRVSGRIGLQKNAGKIEFRRVAVRPLGTEPIFSGNDLAGWRVVPGSKSEFQVEDGTIRVKGGLGFLETEQTWDDFILQAEAITLSEGVNSGIFFRGLPGEEGESINGYELQVQNAQSPSDSQRYPGDRTGGIFRRADARNKVVSKDREWLRLTLVASGPRFASWVNGEPAVAWEDDRKPDENPRRGKRLAAGHISLQGHDHTTDLKFRNLKVAPLPAAD
jgi:hypothetical protein